ncbi:MAG: FAD:protein FMN transferase [Candidatus Omnitrophota bacterium]
MGTFLSIEVFHPGRERAKQTIDLAFNEVRRIEGLLSRFKEGSQIFNLNNLAHNRPIAVDEEIFLLIADCLKFSEKSSGAFDITVAPLIDLWIKAQKEDSSPSQEELRILLSNIGYKNIVLDEIRKTIFFKTLFLKLDFGAAGKGYALDRAVNILKENDIKKANLDFGGQLYYFDQTDSEAKSFGIRNPLQPDEVMVSLPLKNKSISTSANYERSFKVKNRLHGHLINPLTGYPAENGILSVSIISDCAVVADIFSTAVFILGLDAGMGLTKDIDNLESVIIALNYGKSELHVSERLKEVVQVYNYY